MNRNAVSWRLSINFVFHYFLHNKFGIFKKLSQIELSKEMYFKTLVHFSNENVWAENKDWILRIPEIQWTTAALQTPSKTLTFTIKYSSKCKYRESFSIGSSSRFGNTHQDVENDQCLSEILEFKDNSHLYKIYWKFWDWYQLSLTLNILGKTWSISTFWGCFRILRMCRFQNCPWICIFMKICRRKKGLKLSEVLMSSTVYI